MKLLKITLFFIFLSNLVVNAQRIHKGKVIYEINNEKLNLIKYDEAKKNIPKVKELLKNENIISYKLVFNENLSFYSKEKKLSDSKISLTKIMIGKGNYYADNSSKKSITLEKEAYGESFVISMLVKEWKVTQTSKKIGKYLCYKAITKKEVEGRWGKKVLEVIAWFAPEIPVNFGPKEYNNLPGLILELNENGIVYTASKIALNPKEKIKIPKIGLGKKVSIDEFNKISKEMYFKFKKK